MQPDFFFTAIKKLFPGSNSNARFQGTARVCKESDAGAIALGVENELDNPVGQAKNHTAKHHVGRYYEIRTQYSKPPENGSVDWW